MGFPITLVNKSKIHETIHLIKYCRSDYSFNPIPNYVLELNFSDYLSFAHFEIGLFLSRYLLEVGLVSAVTKEFLANENRPDFFDDLQYFVWNHVGKQVVGHAVFLPQLIVYDFKRKYVNGKYDSVVTKTTFYRIPKRDEFLKYLEESDTNAALGSFTSTLLEQDYLEEEFTEQDKIEVEKIFGVNKLFNARYNSYPDVLTKAKEWYLQKLKNFEK